MSLNLIKCSVRKFGNTGSSDPHQFPSPGCAYAYRLGFIPNFSPKMSDAWIQIALSAENKGDIVFVEALRKKVQEKIF